MLDKKTEHLFVNEDEISVFAFADTASFILNEQLLCIQRIC